MRASDPRNWMWSEALELLAQAERLQRELFRPGAAETLGPCWEPPADLIETGTDIIVTIALPGVPAHAITASIENGVLDIYAERRPQAQRSDARIHRLELPHGCFRRRLPLPQGAYDDIASTTQDGCLIVTLRKHVPER